MTEIWKCFCAAVSPNSNMFHNINVYGRHAPARGYMRKCTQLGQNRSRFHPLRSFYQLNNSRLSHSSIDIATNALTQPANCQKRLINKHFNFNGMLVIK